MLTKISLTVLLSDQFYTWSDEHTERTRCRTAKTPQCSCASTAPAHIDPARLPHRAIQTMWQARMQMRRRPRTWPQILSVGELSGPAAANGLRAAGGVWANGGGRVENRRSGCSVPVARGRGFRLVASVRFDVALVPVSAHRTGRAVFPHQMCSNTFDAICVLQNYVAPSVQAPWNQGRD